MTLKAMRSALLFLPFVDKFDISVLSYYFNNFLKVIKFYCSIFQPVALQLITFTRQVQYNFMNCYLALIRI